ncbi:MAG: hypothetical protein KJP23_18265 [Deltaproteobacteria bacterium]|nr:hypothetical protein [Deltaproteobacteria bacterium]
MISIIRITDITEAKKFERRLIQSEKMASLGVLVFSIAHEINNPNNFVSFNIPILREYLENVFPLVDDYARGKDNFELCNVAYPEFRRDLFKLLDNIENGSRRISFFVTNLREYSQGGANLAFSWLDMALMIDKVLSIILFFASNLKPQTAGGYTLIFSVCVRPRVSACPLECLPYETRSRFHWGEAPIPPGWLIKFTFLRNCKQQVDC